VKRPRRRFLHRSSCIGAIALAALAVSATGFPVFSQGTRTIKVVVPFPPGGGIDVLARIMAEQIGRMQAATVVIENRPGAGTVIGTDAVYRAKPDGNTVLIDNNSFVVTPHLRKVDYDPFLGFAPICNAADTPTVIAVNSASPYRTLDELFAAARAKPLALTYGSAPGSALNVAFEMLSRMASFRMTFVPFGGTPPAVSAVLGDHIVVAHVDYPSAAGQIQAGKLRALATGSRRRIAALPQVPTVAESGFKDYGLDLWYGLFAPAQTPKEVVSELADWFSRSVQVPEVKAKLAAQGINPVAMCGADFVADLRKQFDTYGRAIREADIKAE
jgi:tripartite-type tricarboxylate transporter receptor subunit TctC